VKVQAGTFFDCRCPKCGASYGFAALGDHEDITLPGCPACERKDRERNATHGAYRKSENTSPEAPQAPLEARQ
jgi:NAD-dependent SIR2 family protein deacetylase